MYVRNFSGAFDVYTVRDVEYAIINSVMTTTELSNNYM